MPDYHLTWLVAIFCGLAGSVAIIALGCYMLRRIVEDLSNSTTLSSETSTIQFESQNGSFAYSVGQVAGYQAGPVGGHLTITGAAVLVSISFSPTYPVQFIAMGLPNATRWGITVGTTVLENTTVNMWGSVKFLLPSGTYSYTLHGPAGYHQSSIPYTGTFSVNGMGLSESLAFKESDYLVTFTETGLPLGTSWSVTLLGVILNSSSDSLNFTDSNGSYPYLVNNISGFADAPSAGLLTIHGTIVTVAIVFTPNRTATPGPFGLSGNEWNFIGIGIAAMGLMIATLAVLRLRHRESPPASSPKNANLGKKPPQLQEG